MKTYDHIIRFTLLIAAVIIGFCIIRTYMLPDSFGNHGSYSYAYCRADSADEQALLPVLHQGAKHCSACHTAQAALLGDNTHSQLSCESCHGGFRAHNNTTERMAIGNTTDTCLVCHVRLDARPAEFPQIDSLAAHVADQDEALLPGMTCTTCHDPHAPM